MNWSWGRCGQYLSVKWIPWHQWSGQIPEQPQNLIFCPPLSVNKKEFGLLYIHPSIKSTRGPLTSLCMQHTTHTKQQPAWHNDPPPNSDKSTQMLSTNCIGLLTKLNTNRSSPYWHILQECSLDLFRAAVVWIITTTVTDQHQVLHLFFLAARAKRIPGSKHTKTFCGEIWRKQPQKNDITPRYLTR